MEYDTLYEAGQHSKSWLTTSHMITTGKTCTLNSVLCCLVRMFGRLDVCNDCLT